MNVIERKKAKIPYVQSLAVSEFQSLAVSEFFVRCRRTYVLKNT